MKSFKSAGLPKVSSAGLVASCWGLEINPAPPAGDHTALQPLHRTCSSHLFISLSSQRVCAFNTTTTRCIGVISAPVRPLVSLLFTLFHFSTRWKVDFLSSVVQSEKRNNVVQTYATHDNTLVLVPCERCASRCLLLFVCDDNCSHTAASLPVCDLCVRPLRATFM